VTEEEFDKQTEEHVKEVGRRIGKIIDDLRQRADNHDDSKFRSPEREAFLEYTPKLKESTYGSEEYERNLEGLGTALNHHYKENRHHPEHFENGIIDMTLIDLIELLSDWKAATRRHDDGDIMQSIKHNARRFGIGPQLTAILENTVYYMSWEGKNG
jgi:hypothetical protein